MGISKKGRITGTATRTTLKGYALLLVLAAAGCAPTARLTPPHDGLVRWSPVDSLEARLPSNVRVFAGTSSVLPLRAWLVRVPARYPLRVEVSDDPTDVRESTSSFARDAGACVAVNGGYFRMGDFPASAVGLLVQEGRITAPPTRTVGPDTARVFVARAALGRTPQGDYEIGWVYGDSLEVRRTFSKPLRTDTTVSLQAPAAWQPDEALSAGPMLLKNGQYAVTSYEEGFLDTSIPRRHPRTAAGIAANGDLLLMVVDGRQDASRGVDLAELARLMREAGAVDALNLDGGGSSTLVVDGVLVNRPTGGTYEREVMNALVVFCE